MEDALRFVIKKNISEYWKPYYEMEEGIKRELKQRNIEVNFIFCTGELVNIYVYVQINGDLYVYNQAGDTNNAYLIKSLGITDFTYNNKLALFKDLSYDFSKIPDIVLINMCVIENFPIPRLNLSTGAIAAYIRFYQKARVKIIDMQLRVTIEDIINNLENNPPAIIGISISFGQKNLSDILISKLLCNSNFSDSMIVVGNVIPSLYCKEYLMEKPQIIVSYGEGEKSFLDLIDYYLKKKSIENVRGIAYISEQGKYIKNINACLDISNLPFPALDTVIGVMKYRGALTLELSRGCNYSKCTFCPRNHKGRVWRCLSVDRMVLYFRVLVDLCKRLKQNPFFYIADEEFIGQLPHDEEIRRMNEFCKRIIDLKLKVKFDISARIDSIYRKDLTDTENIERLEMWYLLKKIGLQRLFLGVESGCDNQLQRFNKGTTAEQNAIAIKLITALGINIRIGYITFDPLMSEFNDIVIGHKFVERNDILYKPADLQTITVAEVYRSIIYKEKSLKIRLQNKPLFSKISYPLTSLEVLFSTQYEMLIKKYEETNRINLLGETDMNMARHRSLYVNKLIGEVSRSCQLWIDYNFPVLYSLKGIYKTSSGEMREQIYDLMETSKCIDHYLLNYLLYELSILSDDGNLNSFISSYDFVLEKYSDGDILNKSLNSWQIIELKFINKIEQYIREEIIEDSEDKALTNAIITWKENMGNWRMIN